MNQRTSPRIRLHLAVNTIFPHFVSIAQGLRQNRRDRTQKWARFNEARQLQVELERAEARPADDATRMMQRLFSFLSQEIEALRSELAAAIPIWQSEEHV